jgi:hypothetical protein
MLFVGFSLTDDTFHRIAHEVRDAIGPAGERPGGSPFGTALTLTGGTLAPKLWEGDVELVDFSTGDDEAAAARRVELFLDRLLYETTDPLAHFLDPTFDGVLSDEEREFAARLRLVQEKLPDTRAGGALRAILERMGGRPE